MSAVIEWVRPWYPAGWVGHADPECPELLKWVSDPVEGAGWLDPHNGEVCVCVFDRLDLPSWNAVCDTCTVEMADEWGQDGKRAFTKDDAELWRDEHRCVPTVRLIDPAKTRKATR